MNQGVSIYIAIVIMAILLAIVLGISAILVGQIKMIKGMENSVVAFYAADTGIEDVLYPDRANPSCDCPGAGTCIENDPCILDNGASYYVEITPLAAPENFRIRSVGSYRETTRAIEVSY